MFPEYMHLRQRSHDISNSSIYIHVYIKLATIHQVPRQADINPVISHIDLSFFFIPKRYFLT